MIDKHRQFDRMVDGELSAAEQRELLMQCEHEQSWRELALAYVESQTWRHELRATLDIRPIKTAPPPSHRNHRDQRYPWGLALAVLISLGMGCGLGWVWQPAGLRTITDAPQTPVTDPSALSSIPLMVADPQSDSLREMRLPIVQASDLQPDWLDQLTALPEELRFELETKGLDLRRTRLFAPVDLNNGTRVVIPIEYYIERDYQ